MRLPDKPYITLLINDKMEFPRRSKRGFAPLEIRLEKLISVAFNTYSTKWTVYLTDKLYILLDNYLIIIQYFAFRRVLFWAPDSYPQASPLKDVGQPEKASRKQDSIRIERKSTGMNAQHSSMERSGCPPLLITEAWARGFCLRSRLSGCSGRRSDPAFPFP